MSSPPRFMILRLLCSPETIKDALPLFNFLHAAYITILSCGIMAGSGFAAGVSAPQGPQAASENILCFSDIDGTLVHYGDMTKAGSFVGTSQTSNLTLWKEKGGAPERCHKVLRLPPSHTGSQGTISVQTLALIAGIRARGAKFVLITGGRLTTLLQRLPFLPAADAYVCENGGRIFYPDISGDRLTACPLSEDLHWRLQHSATAGNPSEEWQPVDSREGSLWDAYRILKASGWHPDTANYTTCFRLKLPPTKSERDLRDAVAGLPAGLTTSYNLGCLDVYPATSGKNNAGIYLLTHFGTRPENSVLLCDDDNDLCLASVVARVYVPSITSDSVQRAVEQEPLKFVTSKKAAVLATEEMLCRVDELVNTHLTQ